jgi:hypothetical protein
MLRPRGFKEKQSEKKPTSMQKNARIVMSRVNARYTTTAGLRSQAIPKAERKEMKVNAMKAIT